MKVLWVDLISELGGAQRSLLEVCSALNVPPVEVAAAVPHGPLFDRLTERGITVFPVSAVRARRSGWGLFTTAARLLRSPASVSQIIRAFKPDLIHANSLPALLALGHTPERQPVFWHVRDLKFPTLVGRDAARKAARIIAASEAIDETLAEVLSPRLLGRVRVVRNGIDAARFVPADPAAARAAFGLPPAGPVLGMVAHLIPWKRHDAFIRMAGIILKQRPDATFAIVGRDLFKEHARWVGQLKSLAESCGLGDRLRWFGEVDAAEAILPAFDLLVHPALGEPFGRVVCEAQACGLPVIAADSGGPATIIEHDVTGLLAHAGEPAAFAALALELLADRPRAARLAEAGRRRVLEQYTTRHVCEQLAQEYRTALAAARATDDEDDSDKERSRNRYSDE